MRDRRVKPEVENPVLCGGGEWGGEEQYSLIQYGLIHTEVMVDKQMTAWSNAYLPRSNFH